MSFAPPIFFDCVKENGPCTVQKKPLLPTNTLWPFAAKNGGPDKRQIAYISAYRVARKKLDFEKTVHRVKAFA